MIGTGNFGLISLGIICIILSLRSLRAAKNASTSKPESYADCCTFTKKSIFDRDVAKTAVDKFVVIDFETTGLDRDADRIVEISARRYVGGEESASAYHTLVDPGRKIPAAATEIHHITNSMVKNAPVEYDAICELYQFIGEDIIAAHNADFDLDFLCRAYNRAGLEAKNDYIDTLEISRRLYHLSNYKLGTVGRHLGYSTDGLHRAGNDTEICGAIVLDALRCLSQKSLLDHMTGEYSEEDMVYLRAVDKVLADEEISMMMAVRRTKTLIIFSCDGTDWMKLKTTGRLQYLLVNEPRPIIERLAEGEFCITPGAASEGDGWNRVIISSPDDIPALGKLICSVCPA